MNSDPLRDLASVEIYRAVEPSPALVTTRPPARGPAPAGDQAPGSSARREAANVRLAETAFYREAKRIDALPVAAIAERTRGASIVYRNPLAPLFTGGKLPSSLAYAVVSVRRGGERSPLSNIVSFSPAVPPGPPTITRITPDQGRICIEWAPPEKDVTDQPSKIGGYRVYRRTLPDEDYDAPLNADPQPGTDYVDTTAPPGSKVVYTVRATLPGKPRIEGVPAVEDGVDNRDVFPPPAPARLDVLPEAAAVRLIWDPVASPDLAGYVVYRAEGDSAAPVRLTEKPITDTFFIDTSVQPRHRYRYTVVAVDSSGNASPPSPEAVADTL